MARKIRVALPPDLDLGGDWVIEWDAVDPSTGASVAGVKVENTSLAVDLLGAGADGGGGLVGPFMLVPGPEA